MKRKPVVTVGIIIGGLFLGFVLYTVMLFGGAITALALLHSRAAVDAPDRIIEEETSTILGSSSLGGRFALLSGRLRTQVTSIAGTDYQFAAGDSVCGVRGTDLVLDLSADRNLVLSVLHGAVVLASPQGTETPVDGNQRVSVADNASAVALAPGARKRIESQRFGRLHGSGPFSTGRGFSRFRS